MGAADFSCRRLRATTAQYGIWVAQQMAPGSPCYLTAEAVELEGPLDVAALRSSIAQGLQACHALHMRFAWEDNQLWQQEHPAPVDVPLIDLGHEADPAAAARQWVWDQLAQFRDVTRDPLYTTALIRLSPTRHDWVLLSHHIALDGFGYTLVQQRIAQLYAARVAGRSPAMFRSWQLDPVVDAERQYRETGGFDRDRAFWREHLRQVPAPAVLTAAAEPSDAILRESLVVPASEMQALQQAARAAGSDWSAWMLAAIGLWLARRSGQRHLTFGLPVMNRLGTAAIGTPCMAMNIVPFSVHVDETAPLRDIVRRAGADLAAIRPHLYYRYGWIRGDLGYLESQKHLFNQAINLMPFDRHLDFPGVRSRIRPVTAGPVKDLNISVSMLNGGWELTLEANPNGHSPDRVRALSSDLREWLATLAAHTPDAPIGPLMAGLPAVTRLVGSPLEGPLPDALQAFADAAERAPDHPALESASGSIGYRELRERVARRAGQLAGQGVKPGDRVVMLMEREPEAIVTLLAILWAGAAYVPVDPQGPPTRTRRLIDDSRPALIVTRSAWNDLTGEAKTLMLEAAPAAEGTPAPVTPAKDAAAYVLHTSGSSGTPKGVVVGRGALAHFVASIRTLYALSPSDRVLQFAPLHFDASIEEIFGALCTGATLVLRTDGMIDSSAALARAIEDHRITVLDLPTAYWHSLANGLGAHDAQRLAGVRLTIIGGEAALPERVGRWRELLPGSILLNTYGPTEASVIATTAVVAGPGAVWQDGDELPIGLPRPGVEVSVVDAQLYPVPHGQAGELLIHGDALAYGYLDRDDQTAARFVMPPAADSRAYRTGDWVRYEGGQLRFLGRIDDEMKISGLRVDPIEIENTLAQLPDVDEAAVVAVPRPGFGQRLAAFVVTSADTAALRSHLANLLPAPAVPDSWTPLPVLPRNANGKIDRRALRDQAQRATNTASAAAGGQSVLEAVCAAWSSVLGRPVGDAQAHFFELGGKSLQAIQVSSLLSRALEREVGVSLLFEHPTAGALAKALSGPAAQRPPRPQDAFAPELAIQSGEGPPLICLHPAEGLSWCYLALARHLPGIPVWGLQVDPAATLGCASFAAIVDRYLDRVRALQPRGPYRLLGWSLGGSLAQALAVRLREAGERIELVALMDAYPTSSWTHRPAPTLHDALITLSSVNGEIDIDGWTPDAIYQRMRRSGTPFAGLPLATLETMAQAALHGMRLFRDSVTPAYGGDLVLYHATRNPADAPQPGAWTAFVADDRLHRVPIDCDHFGLADAGPIGAIGADLRRRLGMNAAEPSA